MRSTIKPLLNAQQWSEPLLRRCCAGRSLLLLLVLLLAPCQAILAQTTELDLRKYLKDKGLTDLLVAHLEQAIRSENPIEDRNSAAVELMQIYIQRMEEDSQQFDKWSVRIDELSREFPAAASLPTQVSIAFARYRDAKSIFETWIWDRNNRMLQQEANARFASVIQRATDAASEITLQLEKLRNTDSKAGESEQEEREGLQLGQTEAADSTKDSSSQPPVEMTPEQRELETARSQFIYVTAWARYYRSLTLADEPKRISMLNAAESQFLDLIGINDLRLFTTLNPQWFSLNSEWTCRIILGLGMTERALNRNEAADFCFNLLSEPRVPAAIIANQRVWNFHSMIFPGKIRDAVNLVETWQNNRSAKLDTGFWSAVTISGLSLADQSSPAARTMTEVGLIGLAKANEFSLIDEFIAKFPKASIGGENFFHNWLRGYIALKRHESRTSTTADSRGLELENALPTAIKYLKLALADESKSTDSVYRARCRYHYGFALYLDRQWIDASEQFRLSATVLDAMDPQLAEHANWMRCQTLELLASSDGYWKNSLTFALQDFQNQYPRSQHASKIAFMEMMSQVSTGDLNAVIETLRNVPEDDPNYQRAYFEACRLSHQAWSQSQDQLAATTNANQVLEVCNEFLLRFNQSNSKIASQRKAQACLFAADTTWNQEKDLIQTRSWLDRCRNALPSLDSSSAVGSDYYFLVLQVAAQQDDSETQSLAADWLLRNTAKPQHIRIALITKAQVSDAQLQAELQQGKTVTQRDYHRVIDSYQRLLDEYQANENQQTLDSGTDASGNVLAARLRIAQLQLAAGMNKQANQSFSILLEENPAQVAFLSGLANSEFRLGQYAKAAQRFQLLSSSTAAGSEVWLDAKYHLLQCLNKSGDSSDHAKAAKILKQTLLMVPDLQGEWQQKFQELAQRLESDRGE